jgi:uncharacterized membrane protein
MKQPKIHIPKAKLENIFDVIGITLYILSIIYLISQFGALPDRVPGHFNGAGEVDRWGSKMELIILPLVGGGLWLLFTVLEKYPHQLNYLNLKEDNVEAQYKNGRLMLNVLKNEIVVFFSLITYGMVQIAQGEMEGLGGAFLPVFLGVILGSTFVFMIRMVKM